MTDTIKISRELLERAIDHLEDGAHLKPHWDTAEELRSLLAQPSEPHCKWVRDEDTGAYETACGSVWHLTDGGEPEEHCQYYCHHCGKPIDDEVQTNED